MNLTVMGMAVSDQVRSGRLGSKVCPEFAPGGTADTPLSWMKAPHLELPNDLYR
jgi:hypothetical protein